METQHTHHVPKDRTKFSVKDISSAIIIAGVLIAGAILLKGSNSTPEGQIKIDPISREELFLGEKNAKISVILYEDFQCPFCAAVTGLQENSQAIDYLKQRDASWSPFVLGLKNDFVNTRKVKLAYRNYPFLGAESNQAYEASLCAKEQGKFFEYHDYLFANHKGENNGDFSDANLKSFAGILGLNQVDFDSCLDSDKYSNAVEETKKKAEEAGVKGTPKGFILKNGKLVDTIDGALPYSMVKTKIENALK